MNAHEQFLELAAAAIDFELDGAENAALELHLSTCVPCRRRVAGLRHDAEVGRQLAPFVLAPERAQRVWRRIEHPRRGSLATMRVIAVAALLGLLAIAGLTVGASLQRDRDLSEAVSPPPLVRVPAEASPAPTAATPSDDAPRVAGFAPETVVEIVVTDLRVRTEPTVDDTRSAKLEPLLGLGTRLRVVDGPVIADDYEWYRVEAIGWPHRGWVAAADHDGEPWIEDPALRAGSSVTFSEVEQSIVAQLRPDAALGCTPRVAGLPSGSVAGIECRLSTALVARVGAYRFGSPQDATTAYLERLSSTSVTFGSGDCAVGQSGDAAWSSGSGETVEFAGAEWATGRVGCFIDQYGAANVRTTCGPTYIGILGREYDLADLYGWAWQTTEPMGADASSPGICASLADE